MSRLLSKLEKSEVFSRKKESCGKKEFEGAVKNGIKFVVFYT